MFDDSDISKVPVKNPKIMATRSKGAFAYSFDSDTKTAYADNCANCHIWNDFEDFKDYRELKPEKSMSVLKLLEILPAQLELEL